MLRQMNFVIVAMMGALFALPASASEPRLPRYNFKVGQQLTYVGDSIFNYENGTLEESSSIQLTVVEQNADGFRVVVRTGNREVQNRKGQPASSPRDAQEDVRYFWLNIRSDGRLVSGSPAAGTVPNEVPIVIPPLPLNENQLTGTWVKESAMPGETEVFKSEQAALNNSWSFGSSTEGLFKDIYGIVQDRSYQFDLSKGAVVSIENRVKQDYGFHGTGSDHTHLESDRMLPADQTHALFDDCKALLDTQSAVSARLRDINASTDAAKLKDELKGLVASAMSRVSSAEIKSALKKQLDSLDRQVTYEVDDARRIAAVVNNPVPDVSAKDMDGRTHHLSEYRGKVLVLDFWYRGCGWCIRSMPQLKEISDDFKDQPVQLIGMNTDREPANAKFVIDAMKLNYLTLRVDQDAVEKFHVNGFPSLLVIDRNGIVREFHVGYSPHLRDDLEKKIRSLLAAH